VADAVEFDVLYSNVIDYKTAPRQLHMQPLFSSTRPPEPSYTQGF
jgi:hypothetical protein